MASGLSNISLQHLDLNMTLLTVPYDDVFGTLVRDYLCGSSLKSLTISNNYIHQLGDVMSKCLPELEVFSCSHNAMFEHTADVLDLLNMANIRVIDFSWQTNKTLQRRVTQFKGLSLIQSVKWDPLGVYPIAISSSLDVLDVSYNGTHIHQIPEIILLTHVNMRILRAVQTGIMNITKPVHCHYSPRIEEIDVTNNTINFIHQDVFTKCDWVLTWKLNMRGNRLGNLLKTQGSRPFFKPLSGLKVCICKHRTSIQFISNFHYCLTL